MTFIPPYDDELVMAGQGTIANEILRQWRDVEYVFVAVGGGGLIAGVAAYLGDVAPHVKVIPVEYDESACLKAALEANERVILPSVGLFADGTAVAQIGENHLRSSVCKNQIILAQLLNLMWYWSIPMKSVQQLKIPMTNAVVL